jgi:predicted nucleic acid-binding protein
MTGFLLDRDVLGAFENPRRNRNVTVWIEGVPDNELFMSSITVMEARKGFSKARAQAKSVARTEEVLAFEAGFDSILDSFDDRVLPVTRAVADRWGEMLGQRDTNTLDVGVAATAAVFGLVVATRNLKDFRGRGVRLVDPFTDAPIIEELPGTAKNERWPPPG